MFFSPGNISNSGGGIQGPRGPKGDKGDTGPQGPKGEKGDKGDNGIMPSDMVDYIGNRHESLKAKNDADVDWLLDKINSIQGEFNTVHYEGQYITATDTVEGKAKSAILKGSTKYRDIDTGEVLDAFEDGRNLELVSVKMPVLTTVGKNLFTGNYSDFSDGGYGSFKYGEIGKNYTIKLYDNDTNVSLDGISFGISVKGDEGNTLNWMTNGNEIYAEQLTKNTLNAFTIRPNNAESLMKIMQRFNIQIEEGTQATSYEPFKSNILTVNEEVELRGIGEGSNRVEDKLNCLTGELTQRIGEIVLNGSENWVTRSGGTSYAYVIGNFFGYSNVEGIASSFKFIKGGSMSTQTQESICSAATQTTLSLFTNKDELSTVGKLKRYLSQNPVTIQYKLEKESTKTVDLSDNMVYSYDEVTHYDCSSEAGSLVPTLSIDVLTKLNALVSRQKDTIQELTQENESFKAAQQVLLNSQLSFYEALISFSPALAPTEGQVIIQDLYRLKNNLK